VLWSWRAHNAVNARLSEQDARGEAVGSGDPAFPKVQWPTREVCPRCHSSRGGDGGVEESAPGAEDWNEDEVFEFLEGYFHGQGASRPRPTAAAEAAAAGGVVEPEENETLSGLGLWPRRSSSRALRLIPYSLTRVPWGSPAPATAPPYDL